MRFASFVFITGLTLAGGLTSAVGCSDETGGSSASGSSQSTTSSAGGSPSTTSTGTGAGGEGGAGTGGMGSGGEATTSSSSGGVGGAGEYGSCSDCTDQTNGAPAKECGAKLTECMNDTGCAAIYNCAFNGCPSGMKEGACCSLECEKSTNASDTAIKLYRAYDGCVYCQTCKSLCDAEYDLTTYCKIFEPGGEAACPVN